MITRREFLRAAAVLGGIPALSLVPALAAAEAPAQHSDQAPGFFRFYVGDVEVTALYDGSGLVPSGMLHGAPPARMAGLMEDAGLDPEVGEPISINAFLLNTGDQLVLVDAGCGAAMGPTAGFLPANLRAAGYAPEQVDAVLLTHLHPDHALGLADPDGRALFPRAVVRPSKAEADYWLSDERLASASEGHQALEKSASFLTGLRAAMDPYSGRLRPFAPGEAPAVGVAAEPLPGHTPGHCGFRVSSRDQSLLIFGDTMHCPAVQLFLPSVSVEFDVDQEAAVATRLPLLSRLDEESCWVAAAHMPFPGLGGIRARDEGYAWLPVPYTPTPRG